MTVHVSGWNLEVWNDGGWLYVGAFGSRKAATTAAAALVLTGKRRITFKARTGGAS